MLLLVCIVLQASAGGTTVEIGDTVTLIADNTRSARDMENVATSIDSLPAFVKTIDSQFGIKSTDQVRGLIIRQGTQGSISFRVVKPSGGIPEEGMDGTIKVTLDTTMVTTGLVCVPPATTWTLDLHIDGNTDNSDPTYIQRRREGDCEDPAEPPYQLSPGTSAGSGDVVSIPYDVPYDSYVTIQIYAADGTLVRTLTSHEMRNAGMGADMWDGRDDQGSLAAEGAYTFTIVGVNAVTPSESWTLSDSILIDNTAPVAEIKYIKADTPAYDRYTVMGAAQDAHLAEYILTCSNADTSVSIITSCVNVVDGALGVLDASSLSNCLYTLELAVTDYAGNVGTNAYHLTLDRTTNGLKIHVNSVFQHVRLDRGAYVPSSDDPNAWIDDALPAGSTEMETWHWDEVVKYSGTRSHTDPAGDFAHGHYFIHADETLRLNRSDNIIQYVYLDPTNPPTQIMLQFYTGEGEGRHRAYWRKYERDADWQTWQRDFISKGEEWHHPYSWYEYSHFMGRISRFGEWIRLKIPVFTVGLACYRELKGIAFVTYDGKAYWDKTTKSSSYNEAQKDSWALASSTPEDDGTDTFISYFLSGNAAITLSVRDQSNSVVRTLIDRPQEAGIHEVFWDGDDQSGNQVADGTYWFQFSSTNGPIDCNVFSELAGDWSGQMVETNTSVADTQSNSYEVALSGDAVEKYDAAHDPLFAVDTNALGVGVFNPVAIDLDVNDNLFVCDHGHSRIFKLNRNGYFLNELPYPSGTPWADPNFALNSPTALKLDQTGDMLMADDNGANVRKLATGRGLIDICNLRAEIRVPYEDSLVYAYIPIIGTAAGRSFHKCVVDYGYGENPSNWTTIATSYDEAIDDYAEVPGTFTIYGNLATWHVTVDPYDYSRGHLPMGRYTLRLRVYDHEGNFKQDTVRVQVARLSYGWGGTVWSDDGLVRLDMPPGAIPDDFELFSITPVDPSNAPQIVNPDLTLVGKIYEIRPPGYRFGKECYLSMYYTDQQMADAGVSDEGTLKLYRWNPVIQSWIFVHGWLDTEANKLGAAVTEFNDYKVYYAVISDPPPAPTIYQPASPTTLRNITVYGKASPSVSVEVFVDSVSQGSVHADENSGMFLQAGVVLSAGTNTLTAIASDPVGNTSPTSTPVVVEVVLAQPTAVASVDFKTSDFSADLVGCVTLGDSLCIELVGTDASSNTVDSAMVTLTSSTTDPTGIPVQLLETGTNSGVYRGTATVGESSDASAGVIGVSVVFSETIAATADVDPGKTDSVTTADTIPPPAPTIASPTHPSAGQDTFEVDPGEWANASETYGATVARTTNTTATGVYAARMTNAEEGGDFGNRVRDTDYDAEQYPIVSFDYNIPSDVKLNLVAYVNGMWKEIVFTDDPKTVETFDEDIYRTVGTVPDVQADGAWHHAEFNLYTMLKNDDPAQTNYVVEQLFFADYNLPSWMELIMGDENAEGATWYADNCLITDGGSSINNPVFIWTANDASVVEYSYLLDQNAGTVPDTISEGTAAAKFYTAVADGTWYFHVRSLDGGANWGPANHYRIKIDATGPAADLPEPPDGSSSGSLQVRIRITDGSGSGVNPDTIRLKLNDTTYDMDSGGLEYDAASGMLTFSLWKVSPVQDPWLEGETVNATLLSAADHAGNALQSAVSWSWTVDYEELTGGYLSLLTVQGGHTPTWSTNGSRIAFMSERGGNQDIWVMDADDYAERRETCTQLTTDEARDHHPAWSPVDDRIAFVSDRDGHTHIYAIQADGSGLTQITSGECDDSHPSWSPDGLRIAFSRNAEIWTVNADGSNAHPVTANSIAYCLDPVWSPDGERIAFTRSLYMDQVALVNVDGSAPHALTESGDVLPAWSRHSDKLLFVSERGETTSAIWSMNTNGSAQSVYLDNGGEWWDSEPEESPVNADLAFESTRNGAWNIWVKTQLQVTDVSASPDPFSPNGDGILDKTEIRFNIVGGAADASVAVYDATNGLVATLLQDELTQPGTNTVSWHGTNDLGSVVADGTYTYRITVEGAAGATTIEKSATVVVDTSAPAFTNWLIPAVTNGAQDIAVTITDDTVINTNATRLQYGVSTSPNGAAPNVVGWTDFGIARTGTISLSWANYGGKYLCVRGYAEDTSANGAYSETQTRFIADDTDNDGIPDDWERRHFRNLIRATEVTDWDGDGMSDLHECLAGTDPTNALSALQFTSAEPRTGNEFVIRWASASNRFYVIEKSTNLTMGFWPLDTNIPATPVENIYTDSVQRLSPFFYRIKLQK